MNGSEARYQRYIILNAKSNIYNTESIIYNTEFINYNTEFIISGALPADEGGHGRPEGIQNMMNYAFKNDDFCE